MAKMTLEELRKLREQAKIDLNNRDNEGKEVQIIIGMGTCGIAAGAKEALASFTAALKEHGIMNAAVRQTGCMGLCYVEPTVQILMPDMPDTIYGNVSAEVATQIVEEHIIGKKLVDKHIHDKPAADIIG